MTAQTTEAALDVTRVIKKWRGKRGSLIMALHEIQDRFGYVPREVSLQVSQQMDVPMARIYEVLTFYHYFKLEAPGKYIISVCLGTACYLKGANALIEAFEKELGIKIGSSTPDKLFHLQEVRCVGCCGLAPVVVVNNQTFPKVTPDQVAGIIATYRQKGA